MIVNFRQGIITGLTNYINYNNNYININVDSNNPLLLTFADGQSNYLFIENSNISNAWGPFSGSETQWLYWDIDNTTGIRTFGYTNIEPQYGSSFPSSKEIGLHFFNTSSKQMFIWNGINWIKKIRLFAGKLASGSVLSPNPINASQVGLIGSYNIGYILYDNTNYPIVKYNNSFLTTTDYIHTEYDNKNSYRIDSLLENAITYESIPAYHAVCWKGPNQLGIASYINYNYPCIGISVEAKGKNQLIQFVTKGFITNYNNWNFTESAGTPLFIGSTGEITTTVPPNYSLQKIGHIVSNDTIYVDIKEQVLIEETYPTPSPTPSLSASITPTITPTITPSISSSISQSITPTVTPTVTPSPTISVTPTPSAQLTGCTAVSYGLLSSMCNQNNLWIQNLPSTVSNISITKTVFYYTTNTQCNLDFTNAPIAGQSNLTYQVTYAPIEPTSGIICSTDNPTYPIFLVNPLLNDIMVDAGIASGTSPCGYEIIMTVLDNDTNQCYTVTNAYSCC